MFLGLKLQSYYSGDQCYHKVTVEKRTELGWIVIFEAYGSKEEVPLPYLRLNESAEATMSASTENALALAEETNTAPVVQKKATPQQKGDEELTIPGTYLNAPLNRVTNYSFCLAENLLPLPSDTEEQKLRKKKKIKALKHQNKEKETEMISNNKQASWQTFMKKSSTKRVKGSVSGKVISQGSMFASPDAVDGKVGVTGSGGTLTEFEQRKRYKFK